jgi:hypothetical protein
VRSEETLNGTGAAAGLLDGAAHVVTESTTVELITVVTVVGGRVNVVGTSVSSVIVVGTVSTVPG